MYERLVWTLPKACRRPVKALAGWVMRCLAASLRIPPSAKRRLARALSFRYRAVAAALDAIPEEQLARCVLFISLRPHTREAKIAEAARLAGWQPILVHTDNLNFDANQYFHFHARAGSLLQLLMISWLFRGAVIHLFAPDGAQAYLLCVAKSRQLILDLNDTCKSHALQSLPRVWEQCERDAIRAADAMTHRDLRVRYLQKLYGYPLPRQNMLFMDLLPEVSPCLSRARHEGEIHVVSVGWVGKGDSSILRTINALCGDGIHVHMYVNPMQRATDPDIEAYWKLQEHSKYFHFEKPVFGEVYWEQLKSYDFGLSVSEPLVFGETPTSVTPDSLHGAGSSRLMDYFFAGLGVVISPGLKFQWFLARRYALVVVPATREFLENPRAALSSALLRKSKSKQKTLTAITTRGVAQRLGKFYANVASQGQTPYRD